MQDSLMYVCLKESLKTRVYGRGIGEVLIDMSLNIIWNIQNSNYKIKRIILLFKFLK